MDSQPSEENLWEEGDRIRNEKNRMAEEKISKANIKIILLHKRIAALEAFIKAAQEDNLEKQQFWGKASLLWKDELDKIEGNGGSQSTHNGGGIQSQVDSPRGVLAAGDGGGRAGYDDTRGRA